MSQLSAEILEGYLNAYGWKAERTTATSWKAGWSGDSRYFPLFIELSGSHVSFIVKPLIDADLNWDQWPELMKFLMELNQELKFFKVSVDAQDNVILSGDVFAQGFEYDNFSQTLGVLGYYADAVSDSLSVKMQECTPTFQSVALS